MKVPPKNFRSASPDEMRLLDVLFSVDLPSKNELKRQVETALVRTVDENGSIEFRNRSPLIAPIKVRVPVSARLPDSTGSDAFGPSVNLLLHVRDGVIHMLEIYKDDGSPISLPLNFEKAVVLAG